MIAAHENNKHHYPTRPIRHAVQIFLADAISQLSATTTNNTTNTNNNNTKPSVCPRAERCSRRGRQHIYIYIYILCVYYYYYMCLLLLMCSLSGGCPRAERCSRRGRRQVPTPRHLDPAVEAGTVCMYVCVYITRTYMIMFIMIVSSITNICLLLLLI